MELVLFLYGLLNLAQANLSTIDPCAYEKYSQAAHFQLSAEEIASSCMENQNRTFVREVCSQGLLKRESTIPSHPLPDKTVDLGFATIYCHQSLGGPPEPYKTESSTRLSHNPLHFESVLLVKGLPAPKTIIHSRQYQLTLGSSSILLLPTPDNPCSEEEWEPILNQADMLSFEKARREDRESRYLAGELKEEEFNDTLKILSAENEIVSMYLNAQQSPCFDVGPTWSPCLSEELAKTLTPTPAQESRITLTELKKVQNQDNFEAFFQSADFEKNFDAILRSDESNDNGLVNSLCTFAEINPEFTQKASHAVKKSIESNPNGIFMQSVYCIPRDERFPFLRKEFSRMRDFDYDRMSKETVLNLIDDTLGSRLTPDDDMKAILAEARRSNDLNVQAALGILKLHSEEGRAEGATFLGHLATRMASKDVEAGLAAYKAMLELRFAANDLHLPEAQTAYQSFLASELNPVNWQQESEDTLRSVISLSYPFSPELQVSVERALQSIPQAIPQGISANSRDMVDRLIESYVRKGTPNDYWRDMALRFAASGEAGPVTIFFRDEYINKREASGISNAEIIQKLRSNQNITPAAVNDIIQSFSH